MLLERSALESKYMNTVASLSRHVLEADAKARPSTAVGRSGGRSAGQPGPRAFGRAGGRVVMKADGRVV